MAKNIQDRPVNYKDHSQADLLAEAARVGIEVAADASKRVIADALNGTVATTEPTAEANGTDGNAQPIVDAAELPIGTVLEHKDRSGTVLSTVTKQDDGQWLLSTDGNKYTSLSKAAVADHKSRGGKTDSINGRAWFGLPSASGTPRTGSATALPRGKSREALVARRDKLVEMAKDLEAKIADANKAIEEFDVDHAHEAEMKQALAEIEKRQAEELEAAKAKIRAEILARGK